MWVDESVSLNTPLQGAAADTAAETAAATTEVVESTETAATTVTAATSETAAPTEAAAPEVKQVRTMNFSFVRSSRKTMHNFINYFVTDFIYFINYFELQGDVDG